ncbi:MAG: hypothetical protein ACRBCJ_11280 [Hyphomicrobiaceae bacterium]
MVWLRAIRTYLIFIAVANLFWEFAPHKPSDGFVVLGPAMRVDLIIDMMGAIRISEQPQRI